MSPVSWDFYGKQLTVAQNGSWHQLSTSHDRHMLRKNFRALATCNLPFKSFLLFPATPKHVVVELYCTWKLDRTVELIKDVLEGCFATLFASLSLPSAAVMKLPYDIS